MINRGINNFVINLKHYLRGIYTFKVFMHTMNIYDYY